ncbi:hypothetical protein ACFXKD_31130 [Nocardiopsis aegyptia]|uniref:hypothetical protein n=1 Tax=Nocardiopsis aegyptia TaxID=220378 RepID=UPI0036713780
MNLKDHYEQLHSGIHLTIKAAEDAYRLPKHLDTLLKEWAIEEWEDYRSNIDWCDNDLDVVEVVRGLTAFGTSYVDLRRELFSDLHHFRAEPPWREVDSGFALRLPMHLLRKPHTEFALRFTGPSGTGVQRVWTFYVFVSARNENDEYRTRTHEFEITEVTDNAVRIPDSLDGHGDWMEQLFYGLRTLTGNHYHLRTLDSEIARDAELLLRPSDEDEDLS